ncbi:anthranilate synthase component I [Candidatus Omnitrophota bacterium]
MYSPSLKEFLRLSRGANLVPVYKEINADLDTPVSAFLKLRRQEYAFLLESVEGGEKIARFSFLGSAPHLIFKSRGRNVRIDYPGRKRSRSFKAAVDPLDELKKIMCGFRAVRVAGLPRFFGGLVGYMGYDMVRFFEKLPDKNPDQLKLPDSVFILAKDILIFDHIKRRIKIVSNVILPQKKRLSRVAALRLYNQALKTIEELHGDLVRPLELNKISPYLSTQQAKRSNSKISSNLSRLAFEGMVKKAKSYIKKGDIIQAVLSQRLSLKTAKAPLNIYRSLRSINPSPYMFFLQFKDLFLIGASPEMLVRCEEGVVRTRPIAGTRPRGRNPAQDRRLAKELRNDAKEKAEHLMLVDLGRNDLGRVSMAGRVRVDEFMEVEKYSHVMHLVSEVRGRLLKGSDVYDTLRACFPAGTVSGSPKIRAMEIIDELENLKRGPYAGCVGYFSFSHNMDTCITIRTVAIKDSVAYIQAGAGIVADSVPAREYRESLNKAKALIEAISR